MVFKCKMCDGLLNITEGDRITTCEYCGTTQTVPMMNNERIMNLYNRADHYRKNNEYDKALALYEEILNENAGDAEAYWSIILCNYGIEYVEDTDGKRVPTVNRMQLTSVFDDENYKAALMYADAAQKAVYEAEAATINEIQKGILEISDKEEPFDIFICYKETDARGRRTMDSVLATDIYDKLTDAGYKVFFSRITLDDKFGVAYEPYIFAALQSSPIMIAIGTKAEYFNAVWVRNEWSRYLALMKKGAKKTLIPAYKDMDPYDMPEEFAHLQAINMGELGFHQDLLHGIRKILGTSRSAQQDVGLFAAANVRGLLDRAYLYMETQEWEAADACVENALNNEPRNGECYLVKLMIKYKITDKNNLTDIHVMFDEDENYKRIMRFGPDEIRNLVNNALDLIRVDEKAQIYEDTYKKYRNTIYPSILQECIDTFEELGDYRDSKELAEKCRKLKAEREKSQEDEKYRFYCTMMESNDSKSIEVALKYFESVPNYKDAASKAYYCRQKLNQNIIDEYEEREEKERAEQESENSAIKDILEVLGDFNEAMKAQEYEAAKRRRW